MSTQDDDGPRSSQRATLERDFYRSLLELAQCEHPERLVDAALSALVAVTGARGGYLELGDLGETDDQTGELWSASVGFDGQQTEEVRRRISSGIIAESIATGRALRTASARVDARFQDFESVQSRAIDSVLCTPVGEAPPHGAAYLAGREAGGAFTQQDEDTVAFFGQALAPIASAILARARERRRASSRPPGFEGIVGRSRVLLRVLQRLHQAASLDVHLLLGGASGSGKSLLAQAVHRASPRAHLPFVELNCAALPESLIESELFGAERGAHSGVSQGRVVRKVQAAEGGTLFLDEVAEMSIAAQAKLLQLLQSGTYFPLGATEPRQANARFIAATNENLPEAIRQGRMREDLYYRLKVLEVRVPSLAERPEDIEELAEYFCERAYEQHSLPRLRLSPSALAAIKLSDWPGNVRQLSHAIEAAALAAHLRAATVIEVVDVFQEQDAAPTEGPASSTLQQATLEFQRRFLQVALRDADWNVSEVARRLDVARSHVYNLIKAHQLKRTDVRPTE